MPSSGKLVLVQGMGEKKIIVHGVLGLAGFRGQVISTGACCCCCGSTDDIWLIDSPFLNLFLALLNLTDL